MVEELNEGMKLVYKDDIILKIPKDLKESIRNICLRKGIKANQFIAKACRNYIVYLNRLGQ